MDDAEAPRLSPEEYPWYVCCPEERRRWELCVALAGIFFEGEAYSAIWMASRSLYRSEMPTDG